jgi:aminoglycoside 2''-phosphotransferase
MTRENVRPRAKHTPAEVRRGIECCFPDLRVTSVVPVGGRTRGWDSDTFWINRFLIAQVPKTRGHQARFPVVHRVQNLIHGRVPLHTPVFTWYRGSCHRLRKPLAVYRAVPGTPLWPRLVTRLGRRKRARLAGVLGRFLSGLHGIPRPAAQKTGLQPHRYSETLRSFMSLRRTAFPRLPTEARPWAEEKLEANRALFLETRARRTLIHEDLSADHVLWDGRDLTGVIDWGDACIGDPAYDFGGLVNSYGRKFARDALDSYGSRDPGLVERPAEVYLHVGLLYFLKAGIQFRNRTATRMALRYIERARRGKYPGP